MKILSLKERPGGLDINRFSLAGLVITLGIVYGDLGTSPLYTMKAIVGGGAGRIDQLLIYGSLSCVFWTLTLQTTVKYILITLRADNKGEGGVFALFALIRKKSPRAAILTMIGGAALLADGVITPSITVTSSIEGLRMVVPEAPVVPVVLIIFALLFFFQQFGTNIVGGSFGPIMVIWFLMLGAAGTNQLIRHPEIFAAVNPVYAVRFLTEYPGGFILLGAVFLCTTGAEALYSDLGHCGRENIRISWIFVKAMLLLNYFGQGAWLMLNPQSLAGQNPFFSIFPGWFLIPGIIIATAAAIIASQAVITGSFTLISEAVSLNFWPKIRILFPAALKGQVYLPFVNWFLWIMCSIVVIAFRESSNMEAAYGLAITIAMIMTTMLLSYYLYQRKTSRRFVFPVLIVFLAIEGTFLIANLHKFWHGGWLTLLLATIYFLVMCGWYFGRKIKNRYITFSRLTDYLPMITDLVRDQTIPRTATNLVYLIKANHKDQVESKVMYSIFYKQPKKAETYWLLHVDRVDDPYRFDYEVEHILPGILVRIDLHLGFKVEPRINLYFKEVLEDLVSTGEIALFSSFSSLKKHNFPGDFVFILIERIMIRDFKLSRWENIILALNAVASRLSISEIKALNLDPTNSMVEQVPIIIDRKIPVRIKRI
ncbi:MAG TPA: KUP/HAK/KT family potassium transporter [Bacteroidales bacterium]|nr:potassium transporter Kup [Bacteroidales bacterium]HNR41634.1 KUP/HAK/KT family potassium transporter [Bacteroidales bacterium]HPM18662.1 KUP/HAK/KT family potassium transporter [Bacteroidales bacterium]HQG77692.1 KUP/HAK/KT family potassium transporter [Bacteroidales bacterium]